MKLESKNNRAKSSAAVALLLIWLLLWLF